MRYGVPSGPMDNVRDFIQRGGAPVTLALLAANIVLFLAAFFSPHGIAPLEARFLGFSPDAVREAPWTLVTYPLFEAGFSLWLIVTWAFFWISGSSLERSWGSGRYLGFFGAATVVSALSFWAGSVLCLHGIPVPLYGFSLPLSALIVAFCLINPEQTVVLYFFPVRAKYVAWIVAALTFFSYGAGTSSPLFGLFACGGLLFSLLYVRFGRSWADIGSYAGPGSNKKFFTNGPDLRPSRPTKLYLDGSPPKRSPLDFAGRWRDYQERKRLEKLWKNSGLNDTAPEWRDDEGRKRR